ncbi:MAG: hypothetical protein H6765_06250 [Candidatus Peribacteria bacterium]|nr:MAG: hypothetical protein H6765_06250 [Candidatus Peribacteria bacterium]
MLADLGINSIDDLLALNKLKPTGKALYELVADLNLNTIDDLIAFGVRSIDDLSSKLLA